MATPIGRLRASISGFAGAPGVNTFYFFGASVGSFTATDAANARTAVETFYTAIKSLYVNSTTVLCDSNVDIIDVITGQVTGSVNAGVATGITGSGGLSAAPRAAAVCVSWSTGYPVGRRILRGRTFLSPCASGAFGTDGNVQSSMITTVTNAASALMGSASADLAIWHRPHPLTSGNNGVAASAVSLKINPKGAVLRSRRD